MPGEPIGIPGTEQARITALVRSLVEGSEAPETVAVGRVTEQDVRNMGRKRTGET